LGAPVFRRIKALNAVVAAVDALFDAIPPATAPHPTATTNTAAPPRNAIAVLPLFITTPDNGFSTLHAHSETSQHGPALSGDEYCSSSPSVDRSPLEFGAK
jgi:hypothetical protein